MKKPKGTEESPDGPQSVLAPRQGPTDDRLVLGTIRAVGMAQRLLLWAVLASILGGWPTPLALSILAWLTGLGGLASIAGWLIPHIPLASIVIIPFRFSWPPTAPAAPC